MTVRGDGGRDGDVRPVHGTAFGVPYVAWLPAGGESAPLVVGWHLIDPPSSDAALAAALPMAGLPWVVRCGGLRARPGPRPRGTPRRRARAADPLVAQVDHLLTDWFARHLAAQPAA